MVIILNISNVDAANLQAACLCAAKHHADEAKSCESEKDETYHRRTANLYAALHDVVKKRTDAALAPGGATGNEKDRATLALKGGTPGAGEETPESDGAGAK